ncbi:orotidine-5'-phosphate decarboxylase [Ensifer sp. ENS11]|uniref:orotidine-5'-phosphate decarboxylase n=1 Tax=Ensifer sp. ENS11 TaxID=2769291 RepID=UPI001785BFF5|nr:orotidine-5'-phosphate decarboxylase [Ensifer sp. ENS11]MBD9490501.1 orotidine-5'-phosphate decarboxylase [Ensifer sp. ENS11]MDP9633037.1 orotidine-5'-phosphate decarboxylase [Ensifer adhaerens]
MFPANFCSRFLRIAEDLSPLCVGFDPSSAILRSWGLGTDAQGAAALCSALLDALDGLAGIVKPQVAFFEALGPEGMDVLARFIREAKARNLLVIADAKRGDIGSSMEAYASAWLGPDSPFQADAVTANPYLGLGALAPMFDLAANTGTAVFVVVRSSNPEGASIQSAMTEGHSVALDLATSIADWNEAVAGKGAVGPVGAVVGATGCGQSAALLDALPNGLFLAPGIGAQGATMEDASKLFGSSARRVIPTVSRSILSAGPDVKRLRAAIADYSRQSRRLWN